MISNRQFYRRIDRNIIISRRIKENGTARKAGFILPRRVTHDDNNAAALSPRQRSDKAVYRTYETYI